MLSKVVQNSHFMFDRVKLYKLGITLVVKDKRHACMIAHELSLVVAKEFKPTVLNFEVSCFGNGIPDNTVRTVCTSIDKDLILT